MINLAQSQKDNEKKKRKKKAILKKVYMLSIWVEN